MVLAALGWWARWSLWGWLTAALLVTLVAALAIKNRRRLLLGGAGVLVLAIPIAHAIFTTQSASALTAPASSSPRWTPRLVDEEDLAVTGALLLPLSGKFSDDHQELPRAMHEAYVEMRRDVGTPPSPVIDTLLGRQEVGAHDTITFEPKDKSARAAVVFLHGYAGSFTLECWMVAAAARAIDAVTVCPAIDFSGHWGSHNGERTLRATLDDLRARKIDHIYLAGLSNGGVGAIALATKFRSALRGLVVISGSSSAGRSAGLPTLVLQGKRDTMASASTARAFAARAHATYVEFDAGHFAFLVRRLEARTALADWLVRQER